MQSILLQTEFIAFIRLLPQLYRAPDWLREVYLALWLANVWHILHSDSSLLSWNWRCQWDLLLQPKVKTVASVAAWQEMRNCVQISTPDSLLVTGTQQGPLIGQDQCWDLSDVSWVRLSTPVQYWPLARGHRTRGTWGGSCQHQLLVPSHCLYSLLSEDFTGKYHFLAELCGYKEMYLDEKIVMHCTLHCTAEWVGHCLQ